MGFTNVVNAAPLVSEGKLRAFAVSSRKRSVAAPDLPTMIEMGYPDFEAVPWFGLLAPAGTPQAIVDKVHQRNREGAGDAGRAQEVRDQRPRRDRRLAGGIRRR